MAQTYTAYVKKYPDLEKAFQKNKARFKTAAAFGKYHYDKHGKSEGRSTAGGGAPSGTVPGGGGGAKSYDTVEKGRIASTDVYGATTDHTKGLFSTPSGGYDWKVTGAFQDLPKRKGMFGSRRAVKRLPMQVGTTKGYAEVTNPNEKDRSKWEFTFKPHLDWKARADWGEGTPDLMLGNLFKAKEKPKDSGNVGVKNQPAAPPADDGGASGSENIANAISNLDMQYADAIGDLQRAAMGIPKDAPAWVKTHADYLRWLRIRSNDSGFESTIVTSPTGVSSSSLATGVMTQTLMAGA